MSDEYTAYASSEREARRLHDENLQLRERLTQVERELGDSVRLYGIRGDRLTAALARAERAEAEVAELREHLHALSGAKDVLLRHLHKLRAVAEAAERVVEAEQFFRGRVVPPPAAERISREASRAHYIDMLHVALRTALVGDAQGAEQEKKP